MRFAFRPASAADIPEILNLHVLQPWSEENQGWMSIIGEEYRQIFQHSEPLSLLLYIQENGRQTLSAAILVALIRECFVQELLTSDVPYTNQKISRWLQAGNNPFLDREGIAEANSTTGLTMLPITYSWDRTMSEERAANVRQMVLNRFADRYMGNRVRRMLAEPCDQFLLQGCYEVGYRLVNDYSGWAKANGMVDHPNRPFLLMAEKQDAIATVNSFLLRMFSYEPPHLKLSAQQQEVLIMALEGIADPEISKALFVGPDALKARWKAIYRRVESVHPGLLPEGEGGARGIEKRRVLLQHLRDRPEELRPHL